MMQTLDEPTKKCVNALKNIQLKIFDVESNFYEEVYKLEKKFATLYEPLYEQRKAIVNGSHQPTDEESVWAYTNPDEDNQDKIENDKKPASSSSSSSSSSKGIKNFWLNTLKSSNCILEKIQEHDEPILEHLTDIKVKINDQLPLGYTVEFHFSENEWFTNSILTKNFELKMDRDKDYPFKYENGALYKSVGCEINWNKCKNVTVSQTKKKQAANDKSCCSDENKCRAVPNDQKDVGSFFDFFKTRTDDGVRPVFKKIAETEKNKSNGKEEKQNEDADLEEQARENLIEYNFELDFELAQQIKENLIPKAVLFFTGELSDGILETGDNFSDLEDEDSEESDDDEEEDDDDDDDEEEEDEEEKTSKSNGNPKKKSKV